MNGWLLRFTNTLILALITWLTLTGLYGLMWPMPTWMFELHRGAGWGLMALIPWKSVISWRSLKRGLGWRFDRGPMVVVSVGMAALALLVLSLGLMWAWRLGPDLLWLGSYGDAVISWHWMLALVLLLPLALHVWRRWPRPKRGDFVSRRSALKLLALGSVGIAGWWVGESLARSRSLAAAPRRFTGSREQGSFTGLGYPVTHSVGEGRIVLDAATWTLNVIGKVARPIELTYAELLDLPAQEVTATLDCTGGWYSTQIWRGIPLGDLLKQAGMLETAISVQLQAASGYPAFFTLAEANEILLAMHVGGQTLDHGHGFPLRAVVPWRRGWQWVKWMTEVEVL
jgi:hypothetical protein